MSWIYWSRALAIAFDPHVFLAAKGGGSIAVGLVAADVRETAHVAAEGLSFLTLNEWASIIAIVYGVMCILIAMPKFCRAARSWGVATMDLLRRIWR